MFDNVVHEPTELQETSEVLLMVSNRKMPKDIVYIRLLYSYTIYDSWVLCQLILCFNLQAMHGFSFKMSGSLSP